MGDKPLDVNLPNYTTSNVTNIHKAAARRPALMSGYVDTGKIKAWDGLQPPHAESDLKYRLI